MFSFFVFHMSRSRWRYSRDDSFVTLPIVILFIGSFCYFVVSHLQIYKRQRLQRAMENWVTGYGNGYPGPYLDEHVGNIQQYYEWLNLSGLPMVFGSCSEGDAGEAKCPLATGRSPLNNPEEKTSLRSSQVTHLGCKHKFI